MGTHHILDRDISAALAALIDGADTIIFEHPLVTGVGEVLPMVKEALDADRIEIIGRILEELGCTADIDELFIDEAVSLVQRAGYTALGEIFIPERWALNYSRENEKEIAYVETSEDRDRAASEMYIRYLESLSTRDLLVTGMRESLENYWRGIIEIEEGADRKRFYRHGITRRSMKMLEHLVFELMRRDNRALAFLGALHCREIVDWLGGSKSIGKVESVLSRGVLERIKVVERRCPLNQ